MQAERIENEDMQMTSIETTVPGVFGDLLNVRRYAAFSEGGRGGNPAGVMIAEQLPAADEMQRIAAKVGYSETVFAAREADGHWRVRYFSPEAEVPFCGHATIALGAALAEEVGAGVFPLRLNGAHITVEASSDETGTQAALQSPPTRSRPVAEGLVTETLSLLSMGPDDLDPRIPPAIAEAGATHLVLALKTRERLAAMSYDFERGKDLMLAWELGTICLVHAVERAEFRARNIFASHGVYEDPATGAAAAAFAGYLRDLGWPHGGEVAIRQGEDMGCPSRITVGIPSGAGSSIRVSGRARSIGAGREGST